MSEPQQPQERPTGAEMTTPYVARTRVDIVEGLHRRAQLPMGHTADFGVHGTIKELFRLNPDRELPLPVDYIVAAAAG